MRIVCATRSDREGFFSATPLGRSLSLNRPPGIELRLFPSNSDGLPGLYNRAIAESLKDDVIFVFVHDDVHLCDFHWASRLAGGLSAFDVVGLAGNRRRVPGQPGWVFLDERLTRDSHENLSGAVAHGHGFPPESIDAFGPAGQEVKLLDGVLLAVTSATLRANPLRFDERFDFHFYDLDFCRQAERAGLRMGTWPISIIHESKGNFASDGWRRSYEKYLDKWGE
jgi:GT2 family glycosyltransferase